jgi:hypothetical protein
MFYLVKSFYIKQIMGLKAFVMGIRGSKLCWSEVHDLSLLTGRVHWVLAASTDLLIFVSSMNIF